MFEQVFAQLLSNPLPVLEDGIRILTKIADNILKEPNNVKVRILKKTNATIMNKILQIKGGKECLKMLGFEESGDNYVLYATVSLDALKKFRVEVEEWKKSNYSDEQATSMAKTVPVHSTTSLENVERVRLPPLILTYTNLFLRRIETFSHSVLQHENEKLQQRAKKLLPLAELESNAAVKLRNIQQHVKANKLPEINLTAQDTLILELLRWFKENFFEWVDSPLCEKCGGATSFSTMSTDPKLLVYTDRVELHRCHNCRAFTPFPRYNDLNILLETRRGRCGEWANTFLLFCRALGWDSRFVVDEGDHVWTEVYSVAQKRWLHCDPCENICDTPLIYENGWKKQISYVMAYSAEEIQDVTWRYTSFHKEVLKRRKACSETELINALMEIRKKLQKNLSESRRKYLTKRLLEELVEFLTEKKPTDKDQKGRTSGSEVWRMARGETHDLEEHTSSFVWSSEDCKESIVLKYSASLNKYEFVCDDKITKVMQEWQKGTYECSQLSRKVEKDWKMVYLARKEGAIEGNVAWKIDLAKVNRTVKSVELNFDYATFENGEIDVKICSENSCIFLPKGQKQGFFHEFDGCKEITVRAALSGGKGDTAWQHSQLFRQSVDSLEFPFSLKITLN